MIFDLSVIRKRAKIILERFAIWLASKVFAVLIKSVTNASDRCHVACFVEVWSHVADGKPVDSQSTLYKDISNAIDYYLTRLPKGSAPPSFFDQIISANSYSNRQEPDITVKRRLFHTVHKLKIARFIREFANIKALVNFCAAEQFSRLHPSLHNEASVPYWKQKVNFQQLPQKLRKGAKLPRINSYLKARIRESKLKIQRANYPKLDFSLSDLGAFIAISGTLLALLGYFHILIVNLYFNIPYQQYYQASDYISSSANKIAVIFIGALFSAGFSYLSWSTITAYSTESAHLYTKTFAARTQTFIYHFIGATGIAAFVIGYLVEHKFNSIFFSVAILYITNFLIGPLIGRFCLLFFSSPFRALFFINLAYIATAQTAVSGLQEIERALQINGSLSNRTLEFSRQTYSEPEWFVLAITSSFVIMRHQPDGTIRVLPKSELRQIDSTPFPVHPP